MKHLTIIQIIQWLPPSQSPREFLQQRLSSLAGRGMGMQQPAGGVRAPLSLPRPSFASWGLWVLQGSSDLLQGEDGMLSEVARLGQRELLARDDTRTREKHQAANVLQCFSGTSSKLWAKGGSLLGVTGNVERRRAGEQSSRSPGSGQ